MTILITGIAGFIGSRFAKWISENQKDVTIIGVDNLEGGFYENIKDLPIHFFRCDVSETKASENNPCPLSWIFETATKSYGQIDYVYHAGAYASEGRSNHIRSFIQKNNTVGTSNVINECVKHNAHLIFFSSVAVYSGPPPFTEETPPCPIDEYGLSKYMSEQSIQIAGKTQELKWTIVRPRNVYGSGQNLFDPSRNLMGILCYNALNDKPIKIYGDGSNKRAFTHVNDILEPLWRAKDYDGEIFNIGSKYFYTVAGAVNAFCSVADYWRVENIEARHEVPNAWCLTDKSEKMLGYIDTVSIHDGLTEMWHWAKTQKMRPLMDPPPLETTKNTHPSLL